MDSGISFGGSDDYAADVLEFDVFKAYEHIYNGGNFIVSSESYVNLVLMLAKYDRISKYHMDHVKYNNHHDLWKYSEISESDLKAGSVLMHTVDGDRFHDRYYIYLYSDNGTHYLATESGIVEATWDSANKGLKLNDKNIIFKNIYMDYSKFDTYED